MNSLASVIKISFLFYLIILNFACSSSPSPTSTRPSSPLSPQKSPEEIQFQEWLEQADKEDAYAQCQVGKCCYWGVGTEKDIKKAQEWLLKASLQGNKEAYYERAHIAFMKYHYQKALEFCLQAVKGISSNLKEREKVAGAFFLLALLLKKEGKSEDLFKKFFEKAFNLNKSFLRRPKFQPSLTLSEKIEKLSLLEKIEIARVYYQIGYCLFKDLGTQKDEDEALKYLKAAKIFYPSALFLFGRAQYSKISDVSQATHKLIKYIKQAAQLNDAKACYWLSWLLVQWTDLHSKEITEEKDRIKTLKLLEIEGEEKTENINKKALEYLKEAAILGYGKAQYVLGLSYLKNAPEAGVNIVYISKPSTNESIKKLKISSDSTLFGEALLNYNRYPYNLYPNTSKGKQEAEKCLKDAQNSGSNFIRTLAIMTDIKLSNLSLDVNARDTLLNQKAIVNDNIMNQLNVLIGTN